MRSEAFSATIVVLVLPEVTAGLFAG